MNEETNLPEPQPEPEPQGFPRTYPAPKPEPKSKPRKRKTRKNKAKLRWHVGNGEWCKMIGRKVFYFGAEENDAEAKCLTVLNRWKKNQQEGYKEWGPDALIELHTLGILKKELNLPTVTSAKKAAEDLTKLLRKPGMETYLDVKGQIDRNQVMAFMWENVFDTLAVKECQQRFKEDFKNRWMRNPFLVWKELVALNGGPVPLFGDGRNEAVLPEINIFVKDNTPSVPSNIIPQPPANVTEVDDWTLKGEGENGQASSS